MNKHTPGPHNANQKYVIVRGGERYFPIHAKKRGMIALAKRESDAYLYAAAPDLLMCQTMGSDLNTPNFLDWIADRLINVYGENPNVDFVLSLRSRAKAARLAIEKATQSPNNNTFK